eukprot:GCRY01000728.1.p1 GENE.GCRY01000728.1~~GCRY01000728.1.p1  ORF type:complete len:785 (-),score=215.31 GCRY01000728.1:52-2406(-)
MESECFHENGLFIVPFDSFRACEQSLLKLASLVSKTVYVFSACAHPPSQHSIIDFFTTVYDLGNSCEKDFTCFAPCISENELFFQHLLEVIRQDQISLVFLPSYFDSSFLTASKLPCHLVKYEYSVQDFQKKETDEDFRFSNVGVGGTFDRLHIGHKLLLSTACALSKGVVKVGVAGDNLLMNKQHSLLLESQEIREANVLKFLTKIDPFVAKDVFTITKGSGTAGTDRSMDCVVVSKEEGLKNGIKAIEQERKANGLDPIHFACVPVLLPPQTASLDEDCKISSSTSRQVANLQLQHYPLGALHHPPPWMRYLTRLASLSPSAPLHLARPYCIGVTGGIASGKSTVARAVSSHLGALYIDADKTAHECYSPGTPSFHRIVEAFGEEIVGQDGCIDRKSLGAKVFGPGCESALALLSSITHPATRDLVAQKISAYWGDSPRHPLPLPAAEGSVVVIVEAALLIEAGWVDMMDELWVVGCSPKEACQRLMVRNQFTEEEALKRIHSQANPREKAPQADVIISTDMDKSDLEVKLKELCADLLSRISLAVCSNGCLHPLHFLEAWTHLTTVQLSIAPSLAHEWGQGLFARYTESGRVYHSDSHVMALVRLADRLRPALSAPTAVFLAIFFHDAVYALPSANPSSPNRKSNEEESIDLFRLFAKETNLDPQMVAAVVEMIDLTRFHGGPQMVRPSSSDAALFLDMDMAILGAPPEEYQRYAAGVAREFSACPGPYCEGRGLFLERLLAHGPLGVFHSALFATALWPRAVDNIATELQQLRSGTPTTG